MPSRALHALADWLGTSAGFAISQGAGLLFLPAGWMLGWSSGWQLAWTLFLSVATYMIGGIIVVGQSRGERAIQAKLDEMVRAEPRARNELVGIERD